MLRTRVGYKVNEIISTGEGRNVADVWGCGTIVWKRGVICGCVVRDALLAHEGRALLYPCEGHENELDENARHE